MDNESVKIKVELEAEDTLGVLLKRVHVELPTTRVDLRKQATALVERLSYLDTLKVLEVDGISNAALIRSEKPTDEGFTEIIIRGGNSISLERRGAALHISRKILERLTTDLSNSGTGV